MRANKVSACLAASVVLVIGSSTSAHAQDQPFVFTVSTSQPEKPQVRVQYDAGIGEQAFEIVDSDRPAQRLGMQAFLGHGVTVRGWVGLSLDELETQSSQQAEVLYNLLHGPMTGIVAVGFGMRHEAAGANVLTGRVAAGRQFAMNWRLDGNLLFEKPLTVTVGRDSLDLMTTIGIARRVSSSVYVGVEGVGEDLEGFWDPTEAEGGARLLIGPSIRFTPASAKWQLSAAGGPIVRANGNSAVSGAPRSLRTSGNTGYAVRTLFSVAF
jgi:hypothetical protein